MRKRTIFRIYLSDSSIIETHAYNFKQAIQQVIDEYIDENIQDSEILCIERITR